MSTSAVTHFHYNVPARRSTARGKLIMFDIGGWQVSVEEKGAEREPVATIDGFAADPQRLIDEAASQQFSATSPYYPGIRAQMQADGAAQLLAAITPLCERVFGKAFKFEGCFYSIVTTRPNQLAPIQRLPHYDGMEEGRLALILYLCNPAHGGTSFYRHRRTGFETVSEERFGIYRDALAMDVREHGLPPTEYILGDTPIFDRLPGPAPLFNRALLYRGRNLHSGDIARDFAFDPDPRTGRLTLNAFMVEDPSCP